MTLGTVPLFISPPLVDECLERLDNTLECFLVASLLPHHTVLTSPLFGTAPIVHVGSVYNEDQWRLLD